MGIAIGVAATVILLVICVVRWPIKRRRAHRSKAENNAEPSFFGGKAELLGESRKAGIEGHGQEIYEKTGHGTAAEMANNPRYELEGSWHGHEMHTRSERE